MNLIKLFTREEPIAGLEISDTDIRLALLEFNKEKSADEIKFLAEEPLEEGVIAEGVLKKTDEFVKTVKKLISGLPIKIRYVVASLPADNVYAHIFSFPKTISGEKLEETIKLTVGFQLPVKPENVYLDWEKTKEDNEQNEIFLAAGPKQHINDYVNAIGAANLRPIAVEFHPLSLARVIDIPPEETVLIKTVQRTSAGFFVIKNKILRFLRMLPKNFLEENFLKEETRKIGDFYESESGLKVKLIDIDQAKIVQSLSGGEKFKENPGRWMISVGAGIRGLLPREKDTLVSLMPVGTEEAYEYQKAVTFSELISALTIGLSVFFSAVFILSWLLMNTIQERVANRIENLNAIPLPTNIVELEERAKNFNRLIAATSELAKNISNWSKFFEELKSRAVPGVIINNISIPSLNDAISMNGVAQNRVQLNLFKKNLTESYLFDAVNLPITNLEQKENIPFSVVFKIKDPAIFYGN